MFGVDIVIIAMCTAARATGHWANPAVTQFTDLLVQRHICGEDVAGLGDLKNCQHLL